MSEIEGKKEAKSNTLTTSRQYWESKNIYKTWFQIKSEVLAQQWARTEQ